MRSPASIPFWPMLGFGIYAGLYFSLIFHPGLVRMDDFGYLQGVIDTLAAGRLRTHAWLEPYSATLSGLCALAYLITGNFPLSTWGLQSIFVAANFFLLFRLIRTRLDAKGSACLALLLASQPVYWHKCSEFSGNVITLTFALLALIAYLRGHWAFFFLAAFLAFANRQNNIALLALPAFHFIKGDPAGRLRLALCFCAYAAAALLLHFYLNRTLAQNLGIYSGFAADKAWAVARTYWIGLCACAAFLSGFGLLTGDSPRANFTANLRRPAAPVLLTALFLGIPLAGSTQLLSFLTPLIGSLDRAFMLQRALIVLIPLLIWLLDFGQIRFDAPLCLVFAFIAVSGLKGFWYDFYLIDPALAALFFRLTRARALSMGRFAFPAAAVLMAAHSVWAYGYKIESDKQGIALRAYERLERAGALRPQDMTDASFGYAGWKLFDHFCRNEHVTNAVGFLCYLDLDRVVVESGLPWREGFPLRGDPVRILEQGDASIGFFTCRYRVAELHAAPTASYCPEHPLALDPLTYKAKPYPLDAREWSRYIASRRGDAGKAAE